MGQLFREQRGDNQGAPAESSIHSSHRKPPSIIGGSQRALTSGQKLSCVLQERGISVRELSIACGVSCSTLYRIMDGDALGYLDTWVKIAGHLGMEVSELVGK